MFFNFYVIQRNTTMLQYICNCINDINEPLFLNTVIRKKHVLNVSILLPCHRCVLECVLFVVLPRFNNNTTNMFSLRIDYFPSFRINNVKCQRYFHS